MRVSSKQALDLLHIKPMQLYHWARLLGVADSPGRGRASSYSRDDLFLLLLCHRLYEQVGVDLSVATEMCRNVRKHIDRRRGRTYTTPRYVRISFDFAENKSPEKRKFEITIESGRTARRHYSPVELWVRIDDLEKRAKEFPKVRG